MSDNTTPTQQPAAPVDLLVEGISELAILRYFQTMNAADYEATAALFAETGAMDPPFEEPIIGTEAIATYLRAEAKGMTLFPREGVIEINAEGQAEIQVTGKVQTPLFGVNVAWFFVLNPEKEITYARIKLLASPQELLDLRDRRDANANEEE
jgi:hypothetical protein